MNDITCVLPGGQDVVRPGKSVSSGRYSTSNLGRLPSSLFTVRWGGVNLPRSWESPVSITLGTEIHKKRNENGNVKRVRHANNVAKKRRCVRPLKCGRTQDARLHYSVGSCDPCDRRKMLRHNKYIFMKFLVLLFLNFYFFGLLLKMSEYKVHVSLTNLSHMNYVFLFNMLQKVFNWTIKWTELSAQSCFCEFNCRCKYDICKQIINNLPNVSITVEYSCKIYFSRNTNLLFRKLVLYL